MHLAFMVDDKRDLPHIEALRDMTKSLRYDVINPKIKKLTSGLALFGSKSISVDYFYSALLQKKIDVLLDQEEIDTIFCYSSTTAAYVFKSRHYHVKLQKLPWIMDFVDMDSHKWRQYAKKSLRPHEMGLRP